MANTGAPIDPWPSLPFQEWKETCATLHRWMQIVGKLRLVQSSWINHSWHATLYLTARGLSTSPIPHGTQTFQIDFDFIDHRLLIQKNDGQVRAIALEPRPVADFLREVSARLLELQLPVKIHTTPNEVVDAIPFELDRTHAAYVADHAHRFWSVLVQADRVFKQFRSRYLGKCSPVHFFWGSFDLAVTRFSGRPAPQHPGGVPHLPDWVAREAYSHEVCSCGFWPGNEQMPQAAFYAYAYPEPEGFGAARVTPAGAAYSPELKEFILPYDAIRLSPSPDNALLEFLQSSYEAAAELAGWNRLALERQEGDRFPPMESGSAIGQGRS